MKNLIADTVESSIEYIPKLIEACHKCSFDIQSGNEAKGINLIPDIIEGLQWVTEAIDGMQKCGFQLDIDWEFMNQCFSNLEQSLMYNDFVSIADLLEYEIGAFLERSLEKIQEFKSKGIKINEMDIN